MDGLDWNGSVYADGMFDPIRDLGKAQESKIIQHPVPPMDSINAVQNVKPGSDSGWGGALITPELCSSLLINTSLSNLMSDFVNVGELQHVKSTGSLEHSLDCLISATNSNNTSTSVEDDGISLIFSDCQTLWSFGANNGTGTVSSGESENQEIPETVSQSSSDRTKPKSAKRSRADETSSHFGLSHHQDDSFTTESGNFRLIYNENPPKSKKPRSEKRPCSSNISFQQPSSMSTSLSADEPDPEAIAQMKEMIYRAAAFRPVNFGLEIVEKPKRKNVRISTDPQTVAARQRRERISEKIRVLQRLVPGGTKMDTASMLDEAANYLKFLRAQVKALENFGHKFHSSTPSVDSPPQPTNVSFSTSFPLFNPAFLPMQTHFPLSQNPNQTHLPQS